MALKNLKNHKFLMTWFSPERAWGT
jgi:hypothetical protein